MATIQRWRGHLVIIGSGLVHLTLGTMYSFGNVNPYITSYLRKHGFQSLTYSDTIWIFGVAFACLSASIAIGGILSKRVDPRPATLIGCALMSLGVFLTYFTIQWSLGTVIITYGIMFGFGSGIAYGVAMITAMKWFPSRKGLVSGIVVAFYGAGSFIFDQIQTGYINPDNKPAGPEKNGERYFTDDKILNNVPSSFLIMGGCYIGLQLIGCLLITDPPQQVDTDITGAEEESPFVGDQSVRRFTERVQGNPDECTTTLTPGEVVKTRPFWTLWFILLCNGQGSLFIASLYKAYGLTFIHDDHFLTYVGAFAATFNAAGRIFWGHMGDRYSFKVAMSCLSALFTIFMLSLGVTSLVGKPLFFIWVCLLFGLFGGNFSLLPAATARSFGEVNAAVNYGLVFTSAVITSPINALLTYRFRDDIGWYGMFFMMSAFSFISFILSMTFNIKNLRGKDI